MSDYTTGFLPGGNMTNGGMSYFPEGCVINQASDVVPWDNRDTLIPKQAYVMVNLLISGVCLPLLFLISLCTNTVNMVVFCKQGLKERVNLCLFSLSLLDMLYVAVAYGIRASVPYMFSVGKGGTAGPSLIFFFKTHLVGFLSLGLGSQVVSTVVALDRCLCVTRPLLVKNLMSTRKTAVLLWLLSLLLITGGYVVDGFRLKVLCVFNVRDNSTVFQFFPTQFYTQNMDVLHIFGGIVFGFGFPTLCAICVTVCTVIIVVKMRKLSQWRETVSSASESLSSRDLALTRMIVGTSVLFIVCVIPTITVRVAINLIPDLNPGGRFENMYLVLGKVFYLATAINSTANFFVYYTYGSRFRQTLHKLCLRCSCFLNKSRNEKKTVKSEELVPDN